MRLNDDCRNTGMPIVPKYRNYTTDTVPQYTDTVPQDKDKLNENAMPTFAREHDSALPSWRHLSCVIVITW